MNRDDAFPSSYLKSANVSGVGETYTITDIKMEKFTDPETQEDEMKPVMSFKETKLSLILNRTNWDRLAKVFGDDTSAWLTKTITLRLEKVTAFGKEVDAIRVFLPEAEKVEA